MLLDGFKDAVKELTDGKGVDVVIDVVGGDVFTDSLRSLAPQGRLLVVGFAAGQGIPEVKVNRLLLNNIDVRGVGWGAYAMVRPGFMQQQWAELVPMIESRRHQAADRPDLRLRGLRPGPGRPRRAQGPGQAGRAPPVIHLEWGPTGAATLDAEVVVVVDVLSFTTTTTVAVERGMTVLPFGWKDERAAAYAEQRDAVLAIGRFEARERPGLPSLSPAAMAQASAQRVVLPSPNGSTICALLAERGCTVVAASLRNAGAVARWVAGRDVAVVASGERWPDDTLRPAVEDLWGAGAVLRHLDGLTPEARSAVAAYGAMAPGDLHACASGRELVDAGFATDVDVAAQLDVSEVVPVLVDGEFSHATTA